MCPQTSELYRKVDRNAIVSPSIATSLNLNSKQLRPACFLYAGTTSYVLFTLDKLICKFLKQFQALLVDDLAQVSTLGFAEDAHNKLQLCQGDISLSIQDQTNIGHSCLS